MHGRSRRWHWSAALLFVACSGGGGGGGQQPPADFAATPPQGTGLVPIAMAGTWEIRASVVMETNDPAALPPLAGTRVVLLPDAVAAIGGLDTSRSNLERALGFPLEFYVNQADGRTLLYGVMFDRRAQGGTRELVALAGGSVNADTIAVEQFASSLSVNLATETFVRSRYTLVRVSGALELSPPAEVAAEGDAPQPAPSLFGVLGPLLGRD